MKNLVIVGHGKSYKGYDPGASGCGYEEHKTAEDFARTMSKYSKNTDYVFNHNHFAEKDIKKYAGKYKTITELHLNASNGKGHGSEVLIRRGLKADALDKRIEKTLGSYFRNRGIKGYNLYNANAASQHGINYRLVEICFIDNKTDMKILIDNFDKIAKELVVAIEGGAAEKYVDPYKYKAATYNIKIIRCDELNVRERPGTYNKVIKKLQKNHVFRVVQEVYTPEFGIWLKLADGGYIHSHYTEVLKKENTKKQKLVIYTGDGDKPAAELVAWKNKCNYAKENKHNYNLEDYNVIKIGGAKFNNRIEAALYALNTYCK